MKNRECIQDRKQTFYEGQFLLTSSTVPREYAPEYVGPLANTPMGGVGGGGLERGDRH